MFYLLTANVLTDDAEGETPMIPSPIIQYSMEQAKTTDLQTTLKVLASPGNDIHAIPGSDRNTDTVVRLVNAYFSHLRKVISELSLFFESTDQIRKVAGHKHVKMSTFTVNCIYSI